MLNTSIENQTHLNFTAGIGTLNYTDIPLHNGDTEIRVLTPKEEFLKRIRCEDPLEGTSWLYENNVNAKGKKINSRPFCAQATSKVSTVKSLCNKLQMIWLLDFV
jgi:hypothetical protein